MLVYKEVSPIQAPNITTPLCVHSSMQYNTVYVAHKHIVIYKYMYLTSSKKTH